MVEKVLVILANSFKNQGRCVAGREYWMERGRGKLGCWIRPVSELGKGELGDEDWHYRSGAALEVGDVARVRLAEAVRDIGQPENWRVARERDGGARGAQRAGLWEKVGTAAHRDLELQERLVDLWPDAGDLTDRVEEGVIRAAPPLYSITIIKPENLRVALWTEKRDGVTPKKKLRARFRYNGKKYDLSLTDPVANLHYGRHTPAFGSPQLEMAVKNDPLICVSLTPPYEGKHFKIVATLFV